MRTLFDKLAKSTRWPHRTILFCAIILSLLLPVTLLAHPLGNFTINRYSRLHGHADAIADALASMAATAADTSSASTASTSSQR